MDLVLDVDTSLWRVHVRRPRQWMDLMVAFAAFILGFVVRSARTVLPPVTRTLRSVYQKRTGRAGTATGPDPAFTNSDTNLAVRRRRGFSRLPWDDHTVDSDAQVSLLGPRSDTTSAPAFAM
eukprot:TRINITY_DN5853_c0_g3_i1.p1 TRINITY_DN5853_c0_g3~~TRINITY_DN5853_c0_g3_i1.p1  ORF type:complete len:122 (+),score=51.21 TRINITY_DN5853_c0_g3_i1:444-809(+)